MMYHFDYLTLLLVGILDAQARIVHRAYGFTKPKEKHAGFRIDGFRNELKNNTNTQKAVSPSFQSGF